uniref:Uncharacterized protein n=1 Tax=Glossina austeni TaxID=7395 RepID=A0A1A9VEQ4_GLOAU
MIKGAIDKRPSSKINRKLQPITEDIMLLLTEKYTTSTTARYEKFAGLQKRLIKLDFFSDGLPEVNSAVPKMQLHFCYNIKGLISFNWVILATSKKSNNCFQIKSDFVQYEIALQG